MTEVNKIQNLGQKIKAKRKAERLSAEDLAIKLNLKATNIYKWEKGSTPSDPNEYLIIAGWLNNTENSPKKIESTPVPQVNENTETYEKVLPIGDLKVTLKDYVNLLVEKANKAEERERELLSIIKGQLNNIDTSSKEIAEDIAALTNEIQAEHRAMMDSIDVAAKQSIGTTRANAHTVELAYEEEPLSNDKKSGIDKKTGVGKRG